MRWTASSWLSVALITTTCAQQLAIDMDIHLTGHDRETTTVSDLASGETEEVIQPPVIDAPRVETSDESENSDSTAGDTRESAEVQTETITVGSEVDASPEGRDESGSEASVNQRSGETREENGSVGGNENGSPESSGDQTELSRENGYQNESSRENGYQTEPSRENGYQNESSRENPDQNESPEKIGVPRDEDPRKGEVIIIDQGGVQGWYKHDGMNIQSFFDIPYGKFAGLFEDPTEALPWPEIHKDEEHDKRCPQLLDDGTFVGTLDCLTLSIFAPKEAKDAKVLLHIHDGNFVSGSGDPSIYGPEYLVNKEVILVLPNYRLGPLGFLCLKNEIAPGNAALKDLTLALDWLKRNIDKFGGDPKSITVSGDGTSGALVGYLALSPKSKNFISKVITESGSLLSHWALDRNPIATARSFAEKIEDDVTEVLNVLENVDVKTLVEAVKGLTFKPCVESENNTGAFINKTPWKLLDEQKTDISFMMGAANYAGMHEALSHTDDTLASLEGKFTSILPNDLKFETDEERNEIAKRVKIEYFKDSPVNVNNIEKLSLCYTDTDYLGAVIRAARSLVEGGATVYLYEFSFFGYLNREHNSLATQLKGAARGDIVGYIFCQDGHMPDDGTDEEQIVKLMTDLWVNFIQTGKPTADGVNGENDDVEWKELQKVEDSKEQWLLIDSQVIPKEGLHLERMRLWTDIYEKHFIERSFATKLRSSHTLFAVTLVLVKASSNFV